jgi:glycosyltransferase involved in cell wall biosynthesis
VTLPATAQDSQRLSRGSVCVLVPTRNEAGNVAPLLDRLGPALRERDARVLFVDDSDDRTPDAVRAAATRTAIPVRLLHRPPAQRDGGLGGAVRAGLAATDAQWAVVMDGDLQHPPETIPRLLSVGEADHLDVVVASRYRASGTSAGLASPARRAVSAGATWLTRLMFPRLLAHVTDPMSGFFAVRRDRVDPAVLEPDGFKILLEILARADNPRVGEVPFSFDDRHDGRSKASGGQGVRFLKQVVALRLAGLAARRQGR